MTNLSQNNAKIWKPSDYATLRNMFRISPKTEFKINGGKFCPRKKKSVYRDSESKLSPRKTFLGRLSYTQMTLAFRDFNLCVTATPVYGKYTQKTTNHFFWKYIIWWQLILHDVRRMNTLSGSALVSGRMKSAVRGSAAQYKFYLKSH